MKVIKIKGDKITLELTKEEEQTLIEYAVNSIIKEAIIKETIKNENI